MEQRIADFKRNPIRYQHQTGGIHSKTPMVSVNPSRTHSNSWMRHRDAIKSSGRSTLMSESLIPLTIKAFLTVESSCLCEQGSSAKLRAARHENATCNKMVTSPFSNGFQWKSFAISGLPKYKNMSMGCGQTIRFAVPGRDWWCIKLR